MMHWIKRNELLLFFLLAYAFSWAIAIPLAAFAQGWIDWRAPLAIHYFVGFGPMLSAMVLNRLSDGREGLRQFLGSLVNRRLQPIWYAVAFSPLLAYGLVALGLRLFQGTWADFSLLGQVNFLPNLGIMALFLWIFTFGLGEEFGRRGFALPRLQRNRSALAASLILWPLWALWHWPMFLYVYDLALVPMILLGMLTGTIFLTWLYNSTGGSLLILILWHGTYNFITASKAGEGLIAALVTAFVMIWAVVVVVGFKPANLSHRPKVTVLGPVSKDGASVELETR
jgi:membrane protease YdiL (CAAX protease family)